MDTQGLVRWGAQSWQSSSPLLFVARMLVLYLIWIARFKHVLPPFLPFWTLLDTLRTFSEYYFVLDGLYWVSLFCIVIGYRFQNFALVVGVLILFQIVSSMSFYSTSFLFSGCLFVLIGVYRPGLEWVFRLQIGVLYFGAGLNKLLDPDWQSGQYFVNFIDVVYTNPLNRYLVGLLGLEFLAKSLSILTITLELTLAIWAFTGRKPVQLVAAIFLFHLSLLIFTLGELSYIYFFLMTVSSYIILPWVPSCQTEFRCFLNRYFSKRGSLLQLKKRNNKKENFFNKNLLFPIRKTAFFAEHQGFNLVIQPAIFSVIVCCIVFLSKYKNHILQLFLWN